MKRIFSVLLTLVIAATLVFFPTTSKHNAVHASSGCTDAILNGRYGFMWQGFDILRRGEHEIPFAAVGVVIFDGAGTVVSGGLTTALGGVISSDGTGAGTYTVSSDCTGSISFTSGDAAGSTFNMVIVSGGTEAFVISTLPSQTIAFDAKKQ